MDLSYGEENERFRKEVRAFLKEEWTPAGADNAGMKAYVSAFREKATGKGYLYRAIPQEFGGSEQPVDVIKAQVIREEFARARAPMEVGGNGMNMVVPTLLERGTQEQKDQFIRKTMSGEYVWGQGYSEPGSGSDLASVRTKAVLDGEQWVINGQKIWTSQGMEATHMFMLARTEPDAPKHAGITYLLLSLDHPGVTRRPIKQITGGATFCEFFFEDVTTPVAWQVGDRGDGWNVSKTTLKHERAAIGGADRLGHQFDQLVKLARETERNGKPAIEDPLVRDALVRIEGWILSHRYTSYRLFSHAAAGDPTPPVSLMMKLLLTEIGHDIALTAEDLIGDAAMLEPDSPGTRGRGPEKWIDQIMGSLGNSIAGGTTNIQRNIIGERGLGLPRDPAMGA
jgi:alkylation response protein AidB-like acyl-CoA dehydrogenase